MKPAEGIKTLVLTLLFLSLLGLTGLIWLDDLQPGGEALLGPLDAAARALGLRPAAAEGLPAVPETSYTEAARPLRLVLTTERIHWRAWEGAAADGLYDRAREQLGEALGSAGMPARRSADGWRDALAEDSLYCEYAAAQPLPALTLWLTGEAGGLPDVRVKRLALVAGRDIVTLWYVNEEDGRPYACRTALRTLDLAALASEDLRPAYFGWESADYPRAPYTLWAEGEPALSAAYASCVPPAALGASEIGAFLLALEINPDTPARFTNEEGTTYMEDTRACRFEPTGRIRYRAPADAPGTPDASVSESVGVSIQLEEIEVSRRLLFALAPLLGGEARFSLGTVSAGANGVDTLTFAYELDGLEVTLADSEPPVRLVFVGGKLTEADIRVLTFTRGETEKDLLPLSWAYRVAAWKNPEGDAFDLRLAYSETAAGQLTPDWSER